MNRARPDRWGTGSSKTPVYPAPYHRIDEQCDPPDGAGRQDGAAPDRRREARGWKGVQAPQSRQATSPPQGSRLNDMPSNATQTSFDRLRDISCNSSARYTGHIMT